jgi:transcriptional regulator with XRE-family HTH domain
MSAHLINALRRRRRELRMSYAALARRSGVSEPTVKRILGAALERATLSNVRAVAAALGMSLEARPTCTAMALRERVAQEKARRLVAIVQGTAALEEQAVDSAAQSEMIRKTVHELVAGSPRSLWSE